ncbi:MAG: MFS transporter [Clostridiales bacterium]|nr:MFS transporter [Clostridiales bacterium]
MGGVEKSTSKELYGYAPEQFKKYNSRMWVALFLFALLYCFLYSGRLNISTAIPMMEDEMGWTTGQLGILSSILFWTYGFGHLVNGRLGEIFGIKRFIVAGIILSALTNICISFQSSLVVICILWGFNGYFQSMLWSPGMAYIAAWWPGAKRGFATGFCNASSSLGTAAAWLAVTLAFTIAPNMGWRAAFSLPTVLMFAAMLVFLIFAKGKPEDVGLPPYKEEKVREAHEDELVKVVEEKGKLYPYVYLFSQWRFFIWCLIVAGSNLSRYGLLTWMPKYYISERGIDLKAGIVGLVMLPLGMALGTWLVPWLSDRLTPYNRLPVVIACAILSACTVFIFPNIESQTGAAAVLFVAGFFIYAINGLVWAFATDIGGRVFAGTAAGVLDWAAYMGAAVQAVFFGFILQDDKWNVLFVVITVVCLLVAVFAFIATRGRKGSTSLK